MRVAARSDVGLVRQGNEDSAYAGPRLQVVADGMGGHTGGEVASAVVIRAMADLDADEQVAANLESALSLGLTRANAALRARIDAEPHLEGMGTTMTAAYNDGEQLAVGHVGDSRAYLLHDGQLRQLTRDQTWVQTLVDGGRITPEEAERHPQRSVLMQALDGRSELSPEMLAVPVEVGDRLLLCSDGLSGFVDTETLRELLAQGEPGDAVDALVAAALAEGAPDNVTVVVADMLDADDSPPAMAVQQVGAVATPSPNPPTDDPPSLLDNAVEPAIDQAKAATNRPRKRRRRTGLVVVVVLAVIGGLTIGGYAWWSRQWYVGVHDGQVAVFQGVPDPVLGLDLSRMRQVYPVDVDDLPEFTQQRLDEGIPADDEDAARERADLLARQAAGFA